MDDPDQMNQKISHYRIGIDIQGEKRAVALNYLNT